MILVSTNPPHAKNICDGVKTIEWRKKPLPVGKALIYETKKNGGCGMVIGEAEVVRSIVVDPEGLIRGWMIIMGCVDLGLLRKYAEGKTLYANFLINPKLYDEPIPVYKFHKGGSCRKCLFRTYRPECTDYYNCNGEGEPLTRPPQSWCYIEKQ